MTNEMTLEKLNKMKSKYRSNYIPRFIFVCFCSGITYYFDIEGPFIISLILIIQQLIWIALVESESKIALIEELRYLRISLDLIGMTTIIYMTGGINSFCFLTYLVLVVLSSLYVIGRYGVFAIIMSHLIFNAMLLLIHIQVFPSINILTAQRQQASNITVTNVIMTNAILFLVATIVHILVHTIYKNLQNERNKLHQYNITMEHEVTLARRIQEQLIPSENPASYIHALYKPMQQVGGDFYDFIVDESTEKIGIFLSDVSGHGVPASLITSMVKTIILQAGERKQDPAALLLYVNDVLQNHTAGNFITAFYGIFDPHTRTMQYSSAGHPQPYLITADSIHPLQGGKNTAIAMFPNNLLHKYNKHYENYSEILPKGGKLLLYTDGLTEARPVTSDDRFFEYAGLIDALSEFHHLPCRDFINSLHERLIAFRGSDSFDDDVCMICLDVQ